MPKKPPLVPSKKTALPKAPPTDLERWQGRAEAVIEVIKDAVLGTNEEFELSCELLKEGKAIRKEVDEHRKSLVAPLNSQVSAVNARYQPIIKRWDAIEARIKQIQGEFQLRQRAKQQKLLAAAAVEAGKRLVTDLGPRPIATALMVAAKEAAPAQVAGVSVREVWVFTVTDPNAVPVEYWSVDLNKVKAAVDAGARDIPGVEIKPESRISVRANVRKK